MKRKNLKNEKLQKKFKYSENLNEENFFIEPNFKELSIKYPNFKKL